MRRLLLVLAINIFAPALSAENLNSHYDYTLLGNFGTACLGYSKGYLNGSQSQLNFIPESHSDFIFSVISEEFGLVGVASLFIIYGLLIYRLLLISINHQHRFAKILSATLSMILLAYISINICMVIGLLPVVGMPLPFVSQGGTALIINLVTIGIILSLRRET